LEDYSAWTKVTDGVESSETTYATSANVDDALDWIHDQDHPWFLWLAFNAGHTPLHLPPDGLYSDTSLTGTTDDIDDRPSAYYRAMVEAMDTEIGRLLDGLSPTELSHTIVIFVGDNGTASQVNDHAFPPGRSKGSLYEGGVHVPLIIAGPGIARHGRRESGIVSTVDIFSTVLELAQVDVASVTPAGTTIDSVSMAPYLVHPDIIHQREWQLSELIGPRSLAGGRAGQVVGDGRYALYRYVDGAEQFYDVRSDPDELSDLLSTGSLDTDPALHYANLDADLKAMPFPGAAATGGGDTGPF